MVAMEIVHYGNYALISECPGSPSSHTIQLVRFMITVAQHTNINNGLSLSEFVRYNVNRCGISVQCSA